MLELVFLFSFLVFLFSFLLFFLQGVSSRVELVQISSL